MMTDKATVDRLIAESKKTNFDQFMAQPLVRVTMSRIPQSEDADGLRLLLQAAFDAGHGAGQAVILMNLMEHMLRGRRE